MFANIFGGRVASGSGGAARGGVSTSREYVKAHDAGIENYVDTLVPLATSKDNMSSLQVREEAWSKSGVTGGCQSRI